MKPGDVTLLLTRPEPAARRFAAACSARFEPFAAVVHAPLQRIAPLPLPDIPANATLAFTSENGVAAAAALAAGGRPAWCVGARTAQAARAAGFTARSADGDAAALAAAIAADPPRGPVLHLAGRHQRGDLVERLRSAGVEAARRVVYDQVAQPIGGTARAALEGRRPVLAPLFSPRSAALLSADPALPAPSRLHLACLGPAVATAWRTAPPAAVETAARPDADAMLAAMGRLLAQPQGA